MNADAKRPKSPRDLIEAEAIPVEPIEPSDAIEAGEPGDRALTVGDLLDGARGAVSGFATSARRVVDRGRYRKVRVSRNGKALLPDIPVAAMAAVQVASLYGAGVARVIAANVGARFLFDVEVINEADRFLEQGRKAMLDGDLVTAEAALLKAVRVDDLHAESFLQLGIVYRLRGETARAVRCFEQARDLDETGDVARRARELIAATKAG